MGIFLEKRVVKALKRNRDLRRENRNQSFPAECRPEISLFLEVVEPKAPSARSLSFGVT